MADEDVVWLLAVLVNLHRGDTVADAAGVADKVVEAYAERYGVLAED